MLVLGIESTCDETAVAVVENGERILSNIVASQTDLHNIYGGVVPELACRRHIDMIIPLIEQATKEANISIQDIDLIAVAKGPGLIGALLIGLNAAKALSLALGIPYVGVNHVEAHLFAAYMGNSHLIKFPALGAVLSGGHTALVLIEKMGVYKLIGQTTDDAVGEAFDKVASLLGLPYPGGPCIEELAKSGDPKRFPFKQGVVKGKPLDFSFSGLKTNVLYTIKGPNSKKDSPLIIKEEEKKDVAASFQFVALNDIVTKIKRAAQEYQCKSILLGGGVTNNQYLRDLLQGENVFFPQKILSLDNAAMIAGLGYHMFQNLNIKDSFELDATTRIPFSLD